MRRNDFFKYLLFGGGGSASRSELESEALPYTFVSKSQRLRNYRIYGNTVNGESVGDLVTEGEHTGEYSVSVTISSNLFDGTFIHRSVIGNSVSSDDPNRRSIVIDISNFNNGDKITFSRETGVGSTFQMYQVNSPLKGGELLNGNVFSGNSETLLATITLDNIANYHYLMIFLNGATQPITDEELLASKIMINVGDTALPYEPYHEPITTNIYLPSPLRKVGDEADYIDFKKQKMYSISRNLWTEEVEAGGVSNDGRLIDSTKRIRSDYIDVEPAKTYTFSSNLKIRLIYSYDKDNNRVALISDSPLGNTSYTFTIPNNAVKIRIVLMDRRNNVEYAITTNDFQWGQLEEGQTATSYKAYSEITELDISLPAVQTIDGTNIITVDTETQPSKVYLQGNITVVEAPTQSLQASPQTIDLQPLSLDVVEKPDLQLEESEQEENIIETTGGVENAE